MKNNIHLRWIIISAMTREEQVNFIKRQDNTYPQAELDSYSDGQIYEVACLLDHQLQRFRNKMKRVCGGRFLKIKNLFL